MNTEHIDWRWIAVLLLGAALLAQWNTLGAAVALAGAAYLVLRAAYLAWSGSCLGWMGSPSSAASGRQTRLPS